MLRKFCRMPAVTATLYRFHASYETEILTHDSLADKYHPLFRKETNVLDLLEQTEAEIYNWKLNKWEFRTPLVQSALEKERSLQQQELLKNFCLVQGNLTESVKRDLQLVAQITGVRVEAVREKNRAWLQEETAKLRWQGDVNRAKQLRDAFLRLEVCGSRDHRLLERLCCIYGMGLLGGYEDAFSRVIKADPVTKQLTIQQGNPFAELLGYIVATYPQIGVIYDFLGFNIVEGYRASLRDFMVHLLRSKHTIADDTAPIPGRIAFSKESEVLFDFADSRNSIAVDDSVYGLPDFLYINGSNFFLITIASPNYWLRSRQIPHKKQVEGIARRGSFVFGIPYEKVRVRNFLLPPNYVDKESLKRLSRDIVGLTAEQEVAAAPWMQIYTKEIDASDVDYADTAKTIDLEEWRTL